MACNINNYNNETDEHKKLQEMFMETHENKYSEDRLAVLSKVDEMVQYTEVTQNKISKIFVKDTDSVKKNITPVKTSSNANDIKNNNATSNKLILKFTKFKKSEDSIFETIKNEPNYLNNTLTRKIINENDSILLKKARAQLGVKGNLIIDEFHKKASKVLSVSTDTKIEIKYRTEPHGTEPNVNIHKLTLNEEIFAKIKSVQSLNKSIKNNLSQIALKDLKQYCFTIIPSDNLEKIDKKDAVEKFSKETAVSVRNNTAPYSGIGVKIMKNMGWNGGGLGKNATGIKEPINPVIQVNKAGLGIKKPVFYRKLRKMFRANLKKIITKYLENYINSDEKKPLQFASFSIPEQNKIYSIAEKLKLKPYQYHKIDRMILIVMKVQYEGWDLIEDLLANGDSTAAYTLLKPSANFLQ